MNEEDKLTYVQTIDAIRDLKHKIRAQKTDLYKARQKIGELRKQVRELAHVENTMKMLEHLQGKKSS